MRNAIGRTRARAVSSAFLAAVLLSGIALATPKPAGSQRTVVRFDDDTIDGNLMRPDGDLVSARPQLAMPSLVTPPRSFDVAARRTLLSAAASLETPRLRSGLPASVTPKDGQTDSEDSTVGGSDAERRARSSSSTR
jgi:hypothetical protein